MSLKMRITATVWGEYMQILHLKIDNDQKCLVDFDIQLRIADGGSSTVLIGENGTGKSSMHEAICKILLSFDSDVVEKDTPFNYYFEYVYAAKRVTIQRQSKLYGIDVVENEITLHYEGVMKTVRKKLSDANCSIFPKRIITYYSGANDKLFPLFKSVNRQYSRMCSDEIRRYLASLVNPGNDYHSNFPRRKYNYCNEEMTSILLCAILGGVDSYEKSYLQENCRFSNLEDISVEIDMKKVMLYYSHDQFDTRTMADELSDIISFIDERFLENFYRGFLYATDSKAIFTIREIDALNLDSISIFNFFEKLSSLFSAKIEAFVMLGESRVRASQMSEGQRQLIKMLGMLGVCKDEDCLVLMDEPDAHMNPKWKYEIKSVIDKSLEAAINTQAIISTHDPLVINGVDKTFIRIFEYNQALIENNGVYTTKICVPTEDTEGMGIDGLLQSEYYGLKTSYDKASSDKYILRQELYIKLINGEITEGEKETLKSLTAELGSLPISYNTIDFLYDDFIKIFKNTEFYAKEYLSYDDIVARRDKIKEIITALYEEQE